MKTTSEASPSASESTEAQDTVEKWPSELPADESSKGQVPVDCTNVPNDPILLALADAARDWASAQDFDQLRSALIGLLSMTNHRP